MLRGGGGGRESLPYTFGNGEELCSSNWQKGRGHVHRTLILTRMVTDMEDQDR